MTTASNPLPVVALGETDENGGREEQKAPTVLEEWSKREVKARHRRTMGRSARRRRAKLKAIQEAEKRLWSENQDVVPRMVPVPLDRAHIWPGVLEKRKESWTESDEEALVGQLGFRPGNAVAVVARGGRFPSLPVDKAEPIVLKLYPLALRVVHSGGKADGRRFKGRRRRKQTKEDDSIGGEVKSTPDDDDTLVEPFPTLYWLTHPLLRTLTSKLELEHTENVRVMEARLGLDAEALSSMTRAHIAYGKDRWDTLTPDDMEWVENRQWKPVLDSRVGVAGIRKHGAVKCLHTHLAHYLSGGPGSEHNVVGRWVMDAILDLIKEHNHNTSESSPINGGNGS